MKRLVLIGTGVALLMLAVGSATEAAPLLTGELEQLAPLAKNYLLETDFILFQNGAVGEATGLLEFVNLGETSDFTFFTPGHIALIERGVLAFSDKILNAETAGAIAAIIFNNVSGFPLQGVALSSPTSIPAVFTTLDVGQELKTLIGQGDVTVRVQVAPIPEPSSLTLLSIAILSILGISYHRRRRIARQF